MRLQRPHPERWRRATVCEAIKALAAGDELKDSDGNRWRLGPSTTERTALIGWFPDHHVPLADLWIRRKSRPGKPDHSFGVI